MNIQIAKPKEWIEFRGPAQDRNPPLVLGPVSAQGGDQQAQDQNKRNALSDLAERVGSGPTEVSTSDTGFPVYLPTLRQRMALRS